MVSGFCPLLCLSAGFILQAASEILVLDPPRLVVEYGAKATANCSTSLKHFGMGWEASQGGQDMEQVQLLTWTVASLTHWDIKPYCFINLGPEDQQGKELPVVVYKRPDTVSIRLKTRVGALIEGQTYFLQCDIQNVAPVQDLKVMWYKQQVLMKTISFPENTITAVNKSDVLTIQPSRSDDEASYWCEAKLELGPEGPQPPPTKKSDPFFISVHYKPEFSNQTETIEKKDEEIVLNCTVRANPPPQYSWDPPGQVKTVDLLSSSISISGPGNYTCTASNKYGKAQKIFIVTQERGKIIFWTVVGVGVAVALLLIVGYVIYRNRSHGRLSNYSAARSSEGQELK